MSKYDQLNYLTLSEKRNNKIPDCIEAIKNEEVSIPEELIGTPIENIKQYFNINNEEDEQNFLFANNNQNIISPNYFKNGRFFSDNMDKDEKKEFLLNYLNVHFGNKVDGKYFQDYLQDIFNLRKYELIDEDFNAMILDYFKKDVINLDDPEDRKAFKDIMFHEKIKFLNKEEAKKYLRQSNEEVESIKEINESNID